LAFLFSAVYERIAEGESNVPHVPFDNDHSSHGDRLLGARTATGVRLDPLSAIVDAFKTHAIVAFNEGRHSNGGE